MEIVNYRHLLANARDRSLSFHAFIELICKSPQDCLHTSSSLITAAIKHFGSEIVVRSGEPTIGYRIFNDPFCNGINAVFGQEFCIKQVVDMIASVGKESGPNRGIVLVGPPASGKTNLVDLVCQALEEYSKYQSVNLYSFYFHFKTDHGRSLDIRSSFMHNPLLLFPTSLSRGDTIAHPRQEFFELLASMNPQDAFTIPTYFQQANLDKRSMEILQVLMENPRNSGKSLSDIIDEYVRVERIEFSNAQGRGIANIDNLGNLQVERVPLKFGEAFQEVLSTHLPGLNLCGYDGALTCANRGMLHIHDAFTATDNEADDPASYKPLLMLLGSGQAAIESTQTCIDTTVVVTTNIEEMQLLEHQLTSSKLLDRIDKIPVNYLLDANSEMDILRRDLANMRENYDVDPNLLRIAAYYAVMTRLLPPAGGKVPEDWPEEKQAVFCSMTPEQKLFIYACQPDDPVMTIQHLPFWHPFRNEAYKLGIDIDDPAGYESMINRRADRVTLEQSGVFSSEILRWIDDEFMRTLWNEHYPHEGQQGISVRQLQNIMRNTIACSDGSKIHVGTFLSQLSRIFIEGPDVHHWLSMGAQYRQDKNPIASRTVYNTQFAAGEGDYGDFRGLARVVRAMYYSIINKEITEATVDRDPEQIGADLRRYLQHALLANAVMNRAFAHVMVPKFTYIDATTGSKVDHANEDFMCSMETVLADDGQARHFREEIAQRFLYLQGNGELKLEEGKSVVASRQDNVLSCFSKEYDRLLSHLRTVEGIDPQVLELAFVKRRNAPREFALFDQEVRELTDTILNNLVQRYRYSARIALDTVVFAIRKQIVDFPRLVS